MQNIVINIAFLCKKTCINLTLHVFHGMGTGQP
jgi:hypothetical protein